MAAVNSNPGQYTPIQQQNYAVLKWVPKVRRVLTSSTRKFTDGKNVPKVIRGTRTEKKLAQSITSKTKRNYGEIDTITYSFERHGVFVHKGVGRGYEAQGGFVIRTAKGPLTKARKPVEWFNPILDAYIPELADEIAKVNADAVLNAASVKIR